MRCEKALTLADPCPDCGRKWVVQPDAVDGSMAFFCFGTEAEARACYEQIDRTNEYDGQRFLPGTTVLFGPRKECAQ